MSVKIIDISEHNNYSDYSWLNYQEIQGVIIKATEGMTYKDSLCQEHFDNLVGKTNIGFYHMLTVTSSPEGQAIEFYNTIKTKLDYCNIIPMLDVEYDNLKNVAEEYSLRFLSKFYELTKIECGVYSGECYFNENFSKGFLDTHTLWVAHYGTTKHPERASLWQYSESEIIGGCKTDCNQLISSDIWLRPTETKIGFSVSGLQMELNRNGSNLIVDGILGEKTLKALPTLKLGSYGSFVGYVELLLKLNITGEFDFSREAEVSDFQRTHNLIVDGVVGKETWKTLIQEFLKR